MHWMGSFTASQTDVEKTFCRSGRALYTLRFTNWNRKAGFERLISDTRRRVKFYSLIREGRKQLDQTADWKRLSGATHSLIRAQDGLWSSTVIVSCELTNDTLALATP
jgi:hypothetical protein